MDPTQLLEQITDFPAPLRYLGVFLFSMVPFIESFGAAGLGVFVGMWLPLTVLLAVAGNTVAVSLVIRFAERIHAWRVRRKPELEMNPSVRQQKLRDRFDKWGVPLCALAGPLIFPSHFTALMLVVFGARKKTVTIWIIVSIISWGISTALFAYFAHDTLVAQMGI